MSYQVLARKWRPRNFAEMVGQLHVVRALTNALEANRLHHAYLFTGTRGVGKTTLARALAKCFNCEQGVSATPCGECRACTEIDEGRHVDLIEVDAASRSKVDETRDLMDNVTYAPVAARHKVYLIDEVHMFSDKSFNALLKTLEEPPAHVKFLLATTDPQKLPITVLSRCLQFNLKPLPAEQIAGHLASISERESIETEPGALRLLSRAAAGSMRDALSLLDQAVAYGNGKLVETDVRDMLGTLDERHLFDVLEALAGSDAPALIGAAAAMTADAVDFDDALGELQSELQQIAVWQVAPDAADTDADNAGTRQSLAARLSSEDVQLYYQMAVAGRRDLPYAPDPRTGFEMTLLRMLAFAPAGGVAGGGARSEPVATPAAGASSAAAASAAGSDSTRLAGPSVARRAPTTGAGNGSGRSNPARASGEATAGATTGRMHTAPKSAGPEVAPRAAPSAMRGEAWAKLIAEAGVSGLARELATNCQVIEAGPGVVSLRLAPELAPLANDASRETLRAALRERYGESLTLKVTLAPTGGDTPADLERARQAQRRRVAVAAIENDPGVAALKERLGARVDGNLVQPLD